MTDRTNEQWVADLTSQGEAQTAAIEDLRARLQRSIYFYLSHERSDLTDRSAQELTQMANDLAQDATLRVIENIASFRGSSRFTTWAAKIAVRLAISDLRRARYKDFSLDNITAEGDLLPDGASTTLTSAPLPSPEAATERAEVLSRIDAALDAALTPRQKQALIAVAIREVPMDLVADQMNTNRNALYKLLHDARRKLRSYLESQGLPVDYMLELFQQT
jgi:RNA polymerase sigma-70 factor, ECF subfamily